MRLRSPLFLLFMFLLERRCPSVAVLFNGAITITGDPILGNIATFSCSAGYQLVGSQKRVCSANGKWSGVQPRCNGKRKSSNEFAFQLKISAFEHDA